MVAAEERDANTTAPAIGVLCHLCGQRVLSRESLAFHFSKCVARWRAKQDERPSAEHTHADCDR